MKTFIYSFGLLPSAILGLTILSSFANAQQAGIDLVELRELAGLSNVDGSGVNLLHVESGTAVTDGNGNVLSRTYAPDPDYLFFNTKTIEDIGTRFQSVGNDGHATSVGLGIYGFRSTYNNSQLGTAPGVGTTGTPSIKALSASEWLNDFLGGGDATPVTQNFDVSNHSYIFNLDTAEGFDQAAAEDVLRRLDYTINEGNMSTVVGSGNGASAALPAGLVQAYNTINVGLTDGGHTSGLTTLNGAGRNSIHVVVDRDFTSGATGVVSVAAAILHQTGVGTDAVKQEVIKATILAGATKDDVGGTWGHTPTQPLDIVYGAGELNVLNNHLIQIGGEVDGGINSATTPIVGLNGWDYEVEILANDERFYEFVVDANETLEELSIALTWNLEVVDGSRFFGFSAQANPLANLSLELVDSLDQVIDSSNSPIDNVEHIYFQNLPAGTYRLKVSNLSNDVSTDYGLAFRSTSITVPTVANVEVNFGETQRSAIGSIDVVFDGEVNVADGAVSILQRSDASAPTNQAVTSNAISVYFPDSDQTVSTIQFDSHVRNSDNALVDGNYQLTVDSSLVTRGGVPMAEDYVYGDQQADGFYSFFGDADGDRDVDNVDFSIFLQTYFKRLNVDSEYNPIMDYDADGDVDNVDFSFFLGRYFKTITF